MTEIQKSPLHIIPSSSLNESLNIFIAPVEKDNTCIICLESDNLIKNNKCSCIYYFHLSCIEKIEKPNQCILCKKELQVEPMQQTSMNYNIQINNNNELLPMYLCITIIGIILLLGIISGFFFR